MEAGGGEGEGGVAGTVLGIAARAAGDEVLDAVDGIEALVVVDVAREDRVRFVGGEERAPVVLDFPVSAVPRRGVRRPVEDGEDEDVGRVVRRGLQRAGQEPVLRRDVRVGVQENERGVADARDVVHRPRRRLGQREEAVEEGTGLVAGVFVVDAFGIAAVVVAHGGEKGDGGKLVRANLDEVRPGEVGGKGGEAAVGFVGEVAGRNDHARGEGDDAARDIAGVGDVPGIVLEAAFEVAVQREAEGGVRRARGRRREGVGERIAVGGGRGVVHRRARRKRREGEDVRVGAAGIGDGVGHRVRGESPAQRGEGGRGRVERGQHAPVGGQGQPRRYCDGGRLAGGAPRQGLAKRKRHGKRPRTENGRNGNTSGLFHAREPSAPELPPQGRKENGRLTLRWPAFRVPPPRPTASGRFGSVD